jgi:hypothetical protein
MRAVATVNPHQISNSMTDDSFEQLLKGCIASSQSRLEFWAEFVRTTAVQRMAEVGVYRGDFAAFVLQHCPALTRYYMLDPWRHLGDWNKPSNHADSVLEEFFQETKSKSEFASDKRVILRGKTTEVVEQIPDAELDLAYIDADHTLKGITIDLIRLYPKVRVGGFLGGDDFGPSMWGHSTRFEPTLVFPFAVYFAEAVGAVIYALPYSQFILRKTDRPQYTFVDLTGQYASIELRHQFSPENVLKVIAGERFPRLKRAAAQARRLFSR